MLPGEELLDLQSFLGDLFLKYLPYTRLFCGPRRNILKIVLSCSLNSNLCFSFSFQEFASRPCIGTRTYIKEGTPDAAKGQRFPPRVFGETVWLTYKEAAERMVAFGSGLRFYGLDSQPVLKAGQTFNDVDGNFMLIVYENT